MQVLPVFLLIIYYRACRLKYPRNTSALSSAGVWTAIMDGRSETSMKFWKLHLNDSAESASKYRNP